MDSTEAGFTQRNIGWYKPIGELSYGEVPFCVAGILAWAEWRIKEKVLSEDV